jgi:hypothetical protein
MARTISRSSSSNGQSCRRESLVLLSLGLVAMALVRRWRAGN